MLGSSLRVPSVQQLAKDKTSPLPARYVRSDQEPVSTTLQVPVIDMNTLLDGDSMEAELNKLHHACKDWGFFQLINHGISESLLNKLRTGTDEFFKLPLEEKRKLDQEEGDLQGYGQVTVVEKDQPLEWADMFYLIALPEKLRKPELLQKLPVSFRNAIDDYTTEIRNLAMKILKQMAKALGMKEEEIATLFDECILSMRLNYYPECHQPDKVIGVAPHSDGSALSLLFQVNQTEGLQVRKDGVWVPIIPLPSAFIINLGDVMQVVSNGIYSSIEHRVVVNSVKERMSFVSFFGPNLDGDFGPSPSLISPETPAKYKRIGSAEFLRSVFGSKLAGKSNVDVLRI